MINTRHGKLLLFAWLVLVGCGVVSVIAASRQTERVWYLGIVLVEMVYAFRLMTAGVEVEDETIVIQRLSRRVALPIADYKTLSYEKTGFRGYRLCVDTSKGPSYRTDLFFAQPAIEPKLDNPFLPLTTQGEETGDTVRSES